MTEAQTRDKTLNILKTIIILALLCGIVLAVALAAVGNQAVDAIAQQAQQPESAAEIILQSRQTAPAAPPSSWSGLSAAGLLALLLVALGAGLLLMRKEIAHPPA